jgi:hypothetical protein
MHPSQSKSSLSSTAARSAAAIAAASSQGINRQKSIIREEVGEAKSAKAYNLNRKVAIPKVTEFYKPNKPKRKAEKEDMDDTKRRRDKADDDMVVEKVIDLQSDKMETDEEDNEDEDEEEESYANFFERNKKEQEDKEQEESESDSAAFSDDEEAPIYDAEGDEVDVTGKKVKKSGYMSNSDIESSESEEEPEIVADPRIAEAAKHAKEQLKAQEEARKKKGMSGNTITKMSVFAKNIPLFGRNPETISTDVVHQRVNIMNQMSDEETKLARTPFTGNCGKGGNFLNDSLKKIIPMIAIMANDGALTESRI